MEELAQTQVMYFSSLVGSIAFALSGFLAGIKKSLDWMGLFIVSFLTASGGGVLRDLLADRTPIILLSNEPFLIALGVIISASLLKLHRHTALENRWLFVKCDAIGLVAFAITGTLVALEIKAPFFGFITLAFLTAAGGAILRDVLVNNVPEVLHSGFYGSIAILVAITIYVLNMMDILTTFAVFAVFICGVALRLVAFRHRWKLPKPQI